jgi:hypothetical protein
LFRGLTQGWTIARWRVQTEPRLLKARAIDGSVAGRSHHITRAGRADPALSCEGVCAPQAGSTLYTMPHPCHPPPTPPPLGAMVRSLAQLGGF